MNVMVWIKITKTNTTETKKSILSPEKQSLLDYFLNLDLQTADKHHIRVSFFDNLTSSCANTR